jgi:hypothetical protein
MRLVRTPTRSVSGRTWRAPRIFAIAALVAAPLAAGIAATPASAGTPVPFDFIGGATSLTGGGHTWMLSVTYTGTTVGLGSGIGVGIQRFVPGNSGYEIHSWSSDAKGSSVTFNSTTGKATFNSGSSLSPVASFKVTFTPTKKTTTACSTFGKETVFTGTLKGSVHLVSGTKPVSVTLSSTSASFTHGTNELTADPCLGQFPCFGDGWGEPQSRSGLPFGTVAAAGDGIYIGTHLMNSVTVERQTELSKATAFIRLDGASALNVPAPKWNAAAKSLGVSANAPGLLTGSGTLTSPKGTPFPTETCYITGKKHTEHATAYLGNAKLSKWKAFVAKTVLTGTLTASSKGLGGFEIYTVS